MPLPIDLALKEISGLLGSRLSVSIDDRANHAGLESFVDVLPADAVAYVNCRQEVQDICRICTTYKVPIIPYGAGSSVEGHLSAVKGGICLDLSGLNQILQFNQQDQDITVEAGVTRKQLDAYLKHTGLFFPVDPGANASFGGMAATRASGTNAVRYGTMRENILSLEVVTADGRVHETGNWARKSAAGYDLTHLYVGSEGTLGVITTVTVRLYGLPEKILSAVCSFDDLENTVCAVSDIIQLGIPIARVELLNALQMKAVNNFSGLRYPEKATLFLEFHGSPISVEEQIQMVKEITHDYGGQDFQWADKQEDRTKLWAARHKVAYACQALAPGKSVWVTNVCVPISELARCIIETEEDTARHNMPSPIVGHVGDGNFHLALLVDKTNPKEVATAKGIYDRLLERAHKVGGTCTGEHGIGIGKLKAIEKEFGPIGMDIMRTIKRSLDPDNILNPGKKVVV